MPVAQSFTNLDSHDRYAWGRSGSAGLRSPKSRSAWGRCVNSVGIVCLLAPRAHARFKSGKRFWVSKPVQSVPLVPQHCINLTASVSLGGPAYWTRNEMLGPSIAPCLSATACEAMSNGGHAVKHGVPMPSAMRGQCGTQTRLSHRKLLQHVRPQQPMRTWYTQPQPAQAGNSTASVAERFSVPWTALTSHGVVPGGCCCAARAPRPHRGNYS